MRHSIGCLAFIGALSIAPAAAADEPTLGPRLTVNTSLATVNWATGQVSMLNCVMPSYAWSYTKDSALCGQFGVVLGKSANSSFDFGLALTPFAYRWGRFTVGAGLALQTNNGYLDVQRANWNWIFPIGVDL